MCEEKIESDSESVSSWFGSESEIDSIDLLMESFVNLLEMFRELEKDSKKNQEMLEAILVKLNSTEGKK